MYKLVLWTGVWSTTGLLCQASATNPSRLSTVQPISLGSEPPSPSVHLFPYSNLWMWLIHEVEVFGEMVSGSQRYTGFLTRQRERLFPAFISAHKSIHSGGGRTQAFYLNTNTAMKKKINEESCLRYIRKKCVKPSNEKYSFYRKMAPLTVTWCDC